MTTTADASETTKRPFGLNWMPHFRIAIPALYQRVHVKRKVMSADTLERDELTELLQTELSGLKCLNSMKSRENVIHLEAARSKTYFGVERSAKKISGRVTQTAL